VHWLTLGSSSLKIHSFIFFQIHQHIVMITSIAKRFINSPSHMFCSQPCWHQNPNLWPAVFCEWATKKHVSQCFNHLMQTHFMNPKSCFFFAACHEYSAYFVGEARKTLSASFDNKISISIWRLDVPEQSQWNAYMLF
jgi:hypothetical protein